MTDHSFLIGKRPTWLRRIARALLCKVGRHKLVEVPLPGFCKHCKLWRDRW